MAETQHTQGEWHVIPDTPLGKNSIVYHVLAGDDEVCRVHNYSRKSGAALPSGSNAALIAAAPSLLAFAQDYAENTIEFGMGDGAYDKCCLHCGAGADKEQEHCDNADCFLSMARAVVAKAWEVK